MAHTVKARLDSDRNNPVIPRTRLIGHLHDIDAGKCIDRGSVLADTIEDIETGERIDLHVSA